MVQAFDSAKGEFPWQVRFRRKGESYDTFCGGSIIDSETVLTAAHCFYKENDPGW